ncbi:hypothetical protein GAYE_SCF40G5440 [Galdieria yellowstonensis]|uniref:Bifunctional polynucleotide phosphatase/kinase n=1 Tax=Galdieria yellowstonensis TaxID=3028027 RepID=A0AAV9IJW4_9RHOD|nr:hypothetical protein GAYE_SCF40G5440 [Galdieria yellowstonensis]
MIYSASESSTDSDIELISYSDNKPWNTIIQQPQESCSNSSTRRILLILVGIPGSGKTCFSKKLESKGWYRVCQDELQTRQQCENYAIEYLSQNKPTVVDRCNVTKEQRATWINIGKQANAVVGCIVFTTPLSICISRVAQREQHPTLQGNDPKTESVVFRFAQEFCAPTPEEGIDFCRRIQTEQDECRILQQLTDGI